MQSKAWALQIMYEKEPLCHFILNNTLDCAIPLISSLQFLPDLITTESAKDE